MNAVSVLKKLRTAFFLLGWHFASYWLSHIHGYAIIPAMVIQNAEVTKDHVIVVINELKAANGPLTLRSSYKPNSLEAYLTDAQGQQHPISPETLRSLKPEIRSWLDGILPPNVQELLSERGAHVRLTAKQDDAALLWRLYQKIP